MKYMFHRRSLALLASACIGLSLPAVSTHALDLGVSANVGSISADVGASTRSGGLDANANASVGGDRGVNADLGAGTRNGLNANVNARALGGSGTGANVNARLGGGEGTGGTLFGPNGLNSGLGLGAGAGSGDGAGAGAGSSSASADVVERFRKMPVNQQQKLLIRCRDVSVSGGYDSGLTGLCRLLRSTASR